MLRVVVAVRPQPISGDKGPPIDRTAARIDLVDLRMRRAREGERFDNLYELPAADAALAGPVLGRIEVKLAAPHELEPHRRQRHPADGTRAALIVDDLGMHRTRPRHRRQRPGRRDRERGERGEEFPAIHVVGRHRRA
jgi:hypothetical protein